MRWWEDCSGANGDRQMVMRWRNHRRQHSQVSGEQRRPGVGKMSAFAGYPRGVERRCCIPPYQRAMHSMVGRTLQQMARKHQKRA
jgi:hypothetical protein